MKKILASFIIFVLCISGGAYAFDYTVPVWSENGLIREVSGEALRRKFFEYRK